MTLSKEGLEAAANALEAMYHGNGDEPFHAMVSKAITAYLAALPAPDGLEAALAEAEKQANRHGDNVTCSSLNISYDGVRLILAAARAYLSATALPDGMEVVAWKVSAMDRLDQFFEMEGEAEQWANSPGVFDSVITPLCDASQAQSALAAMRVERDRYRCEAADHFIALQYSPDHSEVAVLEAQVQRLTEEKEALRKRTGPDMWCQSCGTVTRDDVCDCNRFGEVIAEQRLVNLADELGRIAREEMDKREAAEARIKALEEALRPFADKPDDWTVDQVNAARLLLKEGGE